MGRFVSRKEAHHGEEKSLNNNLLVQIRENMKLRNVKVLIDKTYFSELFQEPTK